jgi:AraC family transcriptional regulator, arabinose operon regulatory protein
LYDDAVAFDLQVSMAGTNWPHALGDALDRPNGFGEYLFLRFRTPMEVRTARGIETCGPGTCLIYSPGHPQWYRGAGVGFRDDWCHVQGSDVGRLLDQASLPQNTLFAPRGSGFYPLLLEEIRTELQRQEPLWQDVVACLCARLILLLGRAQAHVAAGGPRRLDALRGVREHVHEDLTRQWTVSQMAKLADLGENRFAVLYRECFGTSPMEDLIRARLSHAQWLLTNRNMTVTEAAAQSGFRNIQYFSRLFRRRVGCRPSDYHRSPKR